MYSDIWYAMPFTCGGETPEHSLFGAASPAARRCQPGSPDGSAALPGWQRRAAPMAAPRCPNVSAALPSRQRGAAPNYGGAAREAALNGGGAAPMAAPRCQRGSLEWQRGCLARCPHHSVDDAPRWRHRFLLQLWSNRTWSTWLLFWSRKWQSEASNHHSFPLRGLGEGCALWGARKSSLTWGAARPKRRFFWQK